MATFWEILTAIAPVLAVLVSLGLTFVFHLLWNHEKRIRDNERSRIRHGRTLYGDDDDPTQNGLSKEIKYLEDNKQDKEE